MNVFLAVFGTIMGIFILTVGIGLTDLGVAMSLVLSLIGFSGPVLAFLNKRILK